MKNPEIHNCLTCGYEWEHGKSGSHRCYENMAKPEDVIAFFGCFLIDNHEEKFHSEENIQRLCEEVLTAYEAKQRA